MTFDEANRILGIGDARLRENGAPLRAENARLREKDAHVRVAARRLLDADLGTMSEPQMAGLFRSTTKALFGVEDQTGAFSFGKRAGDMKSNIENLRRFVKGDWSAIESEEETEWRRLQESGADDEALYRFADERLKSGAKRRMAAKGSAAGGRGPGFWGYVAGSIAATAQSAAGGTPTKEAVAEWEETLRKGDYERLTDEEKKAWRENTIGEYRRKLADQSPLGAFLKMTAGLSDEGTYIVANAVQTGEVNMGAFKSLREADPDEAERVAAAISTVRGKQKSGHFFKIPYVTDGIEVDFTDDTALNRFQLNLYGFQQSVIGLVADTWDVAKTYGRLGYMKAFLDDGEYAAWKREWDAEQQVKVAMEQGLPDADGFFGEMSQGLAENLHWFIPYGLIGKGAKAKALVSSLKEAGKAAEAATVAARGLQESALAARDMGALARYTAKLAWLNGQAAKIEKALPSAERAAGLTRWGAAALAGKAMAFSAFAEEYMDNADAAGISRTESAPTAAIVGAVNAMVEDLYVPGLETWRSPAEIKALMWSSAVNAWKSKGAAGLRKWAANRLAAETADFARVAGSETLEEVLQQWNTEIGLELDKRAAKLREKGEGGKADALLSMWKDMTAEPGRTFAHAWATMVDTVAETLPSSAGFGLTAQMRMKGRQHLHNFMERRRTGNAGYDLGVADMVQRQIDAKRAVDEFFESGDDEAARRGEAPRKRADNAADVAMSAAREALRALPVGADATKAVMDATGLDFRTAEVVRDAVEAEAEWKLYSPTFRQSVNVEDFVTTLDAERVKEFLPGYVEGSFRSDKEHGLYSMEFKVGDKGETKRIVYRFGASEELVKEITDEMVADGSELASSYEARRAEVGGESMKPWAELDATERRAVARQRINGFLGNGGGVFQFRTDDGKTVSVAADAVVNLVAGNLADIGYGGPRATAATARHETFHALWRFAKETMAKEDVDALYSHFPQLDKEKDVAAGGVGLDEAMAVEFEKYASGQYVGPQMSGWAEKTTGWIVDRVGGLMDALKIGRADQAGRDLTLRGFYDKVLAGKLGTGALGVEQRKVEAAPATGDAAKTPRMNAAPEAGNGESGNGEREEAGDGAAVESRASNVATPEPATLEKPAASNVPGQRFYRIQAGEGVSIVGELVVSDVDDLKTSDKGNLSDASLQNRISGKEREGRINQIAAKPNPRLMGTVNEQANGGFVWALPNGDVFIGNTRTTGATEAYRRGTAGELRDYMLQEAESRGLEIPDGVTKPLVHFVLRRIESTDGKATIQDVVRMTNESTTTEMTSLEKAKNDADVVEKENLAGAFAFRPDGRIDETKSGDAIGRFRSATRAVGLVGDESGMLTKEGQERIFGALLAHFLKGADAATVEKAIGQTDALDMKNEMSALVREASALETLARVKPRFDLRDAVAEILPYYMEWLEKDAAKRAETGKGRGESAKRARRSWEAFMSQGDMFRKPGEAARIVGDLLAASRELRSFDKEDAESDVGKQRAQRFVMDYLDAYAANATAANDEVDMFGTPPATREDLMRHHRATGGAEGGARFSVVGDESGRSLATVKVDELTADELMRVFTTTDKDSYSWANLASHAPIKTPTIPKDKTFARNATRRQMADVGMNSVVAAAESDGRIEIPGFGRVTVGRNALVHGLRMAKPHRNAYRDLDNPATARAMFVIGDVLKNSVPVNEVVPDGTDGNSVFNGTLLLGAFWDSGELVPVVSLAHTARLDSNWNAAERTADIEAIHFLHSVNAKSLQGSREAKSLPQRVLSPTMNQADEISIPELIERVKGELPLFSRDVYAHFGEVRPQLEYKGLRYSISGVYTGTAADYANRSRQGGVDDGPSLLKIGTGEGAQVYGWGLYGSTVRGVAEQYARIATGEMITLRRNGTKIGNVDIKTPQGFAENAFMRFNGDVARAVEDLKKQEKQYRRAAAKGNRFADDAKLCKEAAEHLVRHGSEYEMSEAPGNVYEQTFFTDRAPGDESHLLKWYEPVSKEQKQWIADELNKSIDDPKMKWVVTENGLKPNNPYSIESKFKTGQEAYQFATIQAAVLAKSKNGREYPRLASEFLARAGIDGVKYPVDSYGGKGVKDGDKAGWNYVSFRDDNIRVDHKWTDGQMRYSIAAAPTVANPDVQVEKESVDQRYSVSPAGRNKAAGVSYPDAGEEISSMRFSIGAKRREEYSRLLAKHRPDLRADAILDELDKYDNPKKEKLTLHWIVRGTIWLPYDEGKVDQAIEVAEKAKVDPFKYPSPLELIDAHSDIHPKEKRIDPATVPELSNPRDEGNGVVSYEVADTREGQAAMRRIVDTHWGEDANPWCLLARGDEGEVDEETFKKWWISLSPRQRNKLMDTDWYTGRSAEWVQQNEDWECMGDESCLEAFYNSAAAKKSNRLSKAWNYWKHYNALPKRVAFKDGRLLAFMATEGMDEDQAFDDAAYGGAGRLAERLPGLYAEYERWEESEEGQEEGANFYEWLQHEHGDELREALDNPPEEWWDRRDESHIGHEGLVEIADAASGQMRYSLAPNPNLREDIAAALRKNAGGGDTTVQMKRHDEIVFSDNIPFFEFLGLPNVKVVSNATHVRKFAAKHHLSDEQIADLPNRYNAPVGVFKDAPGRYVVLTDLMAENDAHARKPVMVRLVQQTNDRGETLFLASAYAREAGLEDEYVRLANTDGAALFVDKNKVAALALEEGTTSTLNTLASRNDVLTADDYSWWSTKVSIAQSGAKSNGVASPAQLAEAVARSSAASAPSDATGARASVEAPRRAASPYPNLATLGDEDLVAAALAARMVASPRSSLEKGPTTAHTYGGLGRSTVEGYLRRIKPGASSSEIALLLDTTARRARDMARIMREDLDRGVSESAVVGNLDNIMRDAFGQEMAAQTNRGRRFGRFGAKAEDALADRQAKIVADAVRNQTGIEAEVMEDATGIDLAESVTGILENELNRPPRGAAAPEEIDNLSKPYDEDGGEEGAPEERDVSEKVKKAVDEMLKLTGAEAEADDEARRKRRAAAERRRAEDAADMAGDGEEGERGESAAPGDVAAAIRKSKVELKNPRHLALLVVEFARRYWVKQHGLAQDADPWTSAVAMQFLRKTAQDVYGKLVRTITYSRSRETSMRRVESFATIPTLRRLVDEMEFVGALVNARRIKESAQAMCESLDKLLREKFGATGRFRPDNEELRRGVPAELELRARYMRHVMWLTPDGCSREAEELAKELAAAQSEFDEAGSDVAQSRVFSDVMRKVAMLREFGGLRYKRLSEIEAAVQWWQDAAEGGARELCDEWTDREERTKRLAATLAAAFRNPKARHAVEKGLAQTVGDYVHAHMGFTHLLRDLMRFAGEKERAEAEKVVEWLELEIQKAGTRAVTEKKRMGEAFQKAVERIYGRPFAKVAADLMAEEEVFAPFMGETDAGLRVMPTRARAMQLYASLVQTGRPVEVDDPENPNRTMVVWEGGYHDNIVENGREGQAEELAKLLTTEDMNLIAWMRKWYEENRQGLSDVSTALFGVGVYAETGNYMPVKMLIDPQGFEKPGGAAYAFFPKALTPRIRNKRDFDTSADILSMWGARMDEAAQWKAHAELGLEMRGVFGRSELQKAIVASHGKKARNDVLAFVTDILAGHGNAETSADGARSFMDAVRGWAALGALGGNVGVMFKQTTSIPAFGFEIGMVKTARYLATAFTPEGIAAIREVWRSEERANRWTGGNTEAVANALNDDRPNALKSLFVKSMVTNKAGDVVPALLVGQGIYRDALGRGMSREDAMAYTWMLVERTQQSSRVENRSSFQRRGKLGNMIYQFLTTQQQYLQYELRALREVVTDPKSARKWGGFLRAAALNHFILSSAYYWMGELYKAALGQEPPEDRWDDWVVGMLTGPYGALYGIGLTTADVLREWIKPGSSYGRSGVRIPALDWIVRTFGKDLAPIFHDTFDGTKSWDDVLDDLDRWLSDFNATYRDLSKLYHNRVIEEPRHSR